ncbi:MAG: hypothetical protein RLZZ360_64 [Candidatus Parcubacteria bacterium]|jgi:hypothetical protein
MEIEIGAFHLASLAIVALVIIIADHDGYLYMRGKKAVLNATKVKRLHQLAWVGLAGMIVTGIMLVRQNPLVLEEPTFAVKMLMVAALLVNGFVIGRLSALSTTTPFTSLTKGQKLSLLVSGAVSVSCWLGAAFIGFAL